MPDELDTIRTDRATRSLNFKAGIGYNLFTEKLSQNRFLNNLLVELNFYRFSGSAYGNIYQFGDPTTTSSDIRFTLNIDSSKRIMLDIKPSLFTWRGLSPYLILGAGCGWTKSDYQEYNYTDANPRTISSSSTNKNFVIEGGCGLNYAFNKHVGLSLEYLLPGLAK